MTPADDLQSPSSRNVAGREKDSLVEYFGLEDFASFYRESSSPELPPLNEDYFKTKVLS